MWSAAGLMPGRRCLDGSGGAAVSDDGEGTSEGYAAFSSL